MAPKKLGGGEAVSLPPLQQVVSELAPRKVTLGKLDLTLIDSLKTLEEKLRDHLSTRVTVNVDGAVDMEGGQWAEMLTFGKWDGRWQFLLEFGDPGDPEDWKTQPLVTASREKRVHVFTGGFVEKLVRAAVVQLDTQIAERENAVKIARSLIAALEVDNDRPF